MAQYTLSCLFCARGQFFSCDYKGFEACVFNLVSAFAPAFASTFEPTKSMKQQ